MTDWLRGKGETAERIRATDWSSTPLGPRSSWPQPLRTAMNITLATEFPATILWGESLLLLYNDAYAQIAGQKHPMALGRSTRETWPEAWHINQPICEAVMKRGETVSLENKLFPINRRGMIEDAYFTLCYCPIYLEDGAIGGCLVMLLETTAQVLREAEIAENKRTERTDEIERKKVADALRDERNLIANILETIPVGVVTMDAAGRVTSANPRAIAILGLGKADPLCMTYDAPTWRIAALDGTPFPPDKLPFSVVMATGKPVLGVQHAIHWPDGRRIALSINAAPVIDENGRASGVIAAIEDITELKRGEEAIQETSRRLALALQAGGLAVWDWDLKTGAMVWDDEMLRLYGLTRERFSGGIESWKQGLHPEDQTSAIADCQTALDGTRDYDTRFRIVQPSGRVKHVKASGLVLRDESGVAIRMLGLNQDISEQKHAEQNYEMLFREMLDGFALHEIICDAQNHPIDYRFLAVNPAFERMTGLKADAILGRTVMEVMPGIEQQWIETYGRVALTGEGAVFENYAEALKKHFEVTAFRPAPGQFACIFADITERKQAEAEKAKLESQLAQAQKMESVGRLAGGVAHDFNNMLAVILGHSELAIEQVVPSQPILTNLQEIEKAARRSADLTRQLLAFARKQTVAPKVLDLNQTVEGMLKMLRRLLGEDIHLSWKPHTDLWPVHIDPSQIDQLLVNLCVNARDAIGDVGKITIETDNNTFDEDYCVQHAGYVAGAYVQITVSDDGCGMDKETQAHLFEPFFTTKGVGKGTGLGLATVYGIVKQNNGFINVYSEPGHGTTFKLYLPRHGSTAKGEVESAGRDVVGGVESVLVVEDERAMLDLTKTMLERQGYTVIAACTPGEALQMAKEHPTDIDLLITDVVMPEMNGRDLARNLLSLYPRMKRLFMSGYTANVIAHHGVLDQGVHFIQKPFSGKDLAAKVRETLED